MNYDGWSRSFSVRGRVEGRNVFASGVEASCVGQALLKQSFTCRSRVEEKEKEGEKGQSCLSIWLVSPFRIEFTTWSLSASAAAASARRQHLAVQHLLPMDKHCPSGACSHHVLALSGSHPGSGSVSLSSSRVVSMVDD